MRFPVAATALVVLLGVVLGGIVGGFLGYWVGGIATQGCSDFECIARVASLLVGVFLGVAVGAPAAWWLGQNWRLRLTDEDRTSDDLHEPPT
jgi:hypothetical protein